MKKLLAASILELNPLALQHNILQLEKSGIDMLHLDIMDGHFVPNLSFGPNIVKAIKQLTDIPLDVHLMVQNPEQHIQAFIAAGADLLTVHLEATLHLDKTLNQIRDAGVKAGVAILPATPVCSLEYVMELVDLVLVMSVNPGFSGQKFIPSQLKKIKILSNNLNKQKRSILLSVDGGINEHTIESAATAGANLLVSGSYICQNNDFSANIRRLKSLI